MPTNVNIYIFAIIEGYPVSRLILKSCFHICVVIAVVYGLMFAPEYMNSLNNDKMNKSCRPDCDQIPPQFLNFTIIHILVFTLTFHPIFISDFPSACSSGTLSYRSFSACFNQSLTLRGVLESILCLLIPPL